ncbi:hypothetical protein [Flavobacterium sp.]|jgi:hypothetical protein|uniref:hypothetical protein n=1 Tax=Flavobacterium sp. TaxID=239 RepID=UPI0037C133E1
MKTKKESKFTLEKFEVAKLKKSSMNKIIGGANEDPIGGQDATKVASKGGNG